MILLFASFVLYPLSLLSKAFERNFLPVIFFLSFFFILYLTQNVEMVFIPIFSVFTVLALFYYKSENKLIYHASFLSIIAVLVLSKLHLLPGIKNYLLLDSFKKSYDTIPYRLWINYDHALLAFPLWYLIKECPKKISVIEYIAVVGFMIATLMLGAFFLEYVRFDMQITKILPAWAAVNLFYTCFTEELLFRQMIQKYLNKLLGSAIAGILLTALIFGGFHFSLGPSYILLASVAGLFYGYIYYRFDHVIYSILAHFLLNLAHFIFFSYPKLV